MRHRLRKLLPLGAGLLLGAALLSRGLWPSPEASSTPGTRAAPTRSGEVPLPTAAPSSSVTPAPVAPGSAPRTASVTQPVELPVTSEEGMPSLEVAHPLPQQNEPLEPEKPQTAEWKHGKLVRITEVLSRDVERLETELQAARGRGDTGEARRLEVQIARHRARLGSLREEAAALAKVAQEEARLP